MGVQVIRATRPAAGHTNIAAGNTEKIKVAAYCRVSTDSEEQESSYEAQCRHYTNFISDNPAWKLAGIYADEGISGTSTKKREQFNRMITDCEAGQIDMVITKSISRWARNTIDSLQNIRKLKALGIPVLFEKENINTMDAKGEVLITIMSSIAQQESDSISKNVRMGIQYQMQQGKGRINTTNFIGLGKSEDGKKLVIIPEEAEIIRRIYREYLEGHSTGMIAKRLTADGVKTPAHKNKWYSTTIAGILKNEKYCGDLLMQKYYVDDFLTHKTVKNTGQLPQYFVEDAHDPIIPKEVFYQVQGELQRRSLLKYDPSKLRFGSSMALSGRLVCGHCGRKLKRYTNPNPSLTDWRCRERSYNKKSIGREVSSLCPCRNVPEKEAKKAIIQAFNQLPRVRDDLIRMLGAVREGMIYQIDETVKSLELKMERTSERLSDIGECGTDEENFLKDEFGQMEQEHTKLLLDRAEASNKQIQIKLLLELVDMMQEGNREQETFDSPACRDYDEFFRRTRYIVDEGIIGEDGKVMSFSNDMVIRYLNNVVIKDGAYEVNFKCGLTVSVNIHG